MDYQWKYRVVMEPRSIPDFDGATAAFAIYEVYRDEKENIVAIAPKKSAPSGDRLENLKADIGAMLEAFQLPVLDYAHVIEQIAKAKSTTGKLHDV